MSSDAATADAVLATRSILYPDTQRIIGWDVVDGGFKIVLSAASHGFGTQEHRGMRSTNFSPRTISKRADIAHWIAHTGGPKVLRILEEELQLPDDALARSWRSLKSTGNLSSASVLFMLEDILQSDDAKPGDYGVMIAMGPGFSVELVLFEW